MQRPHPDETDAYYHRYIDLVPDGPILDLLAEQAETSKAFLDGIDEAQAAHRYAPGKWSIKQVVGHITDTERVMGFRALHFARQSPSPLPGMDQDAYVAAARFDDATLEQLAAELYVTRLAHLALFDGFDAGVGQRSGVASGCRFTVRSLVYIIAGHALHHEQVLRERYLGLS